MAKPNPLSMAAQVAESLKAPEKPKAAQPPAPAIIAPRVLLDEGISTRQTLTAMAMGAVGALAFSRLTRWLR